MKNTFFTQLAIFSILCATALPAQKQNSWTQWGGPDQNFTVPDPGLAASWPEDEPPELWSRELGFGNSAIVGAGDTIFTMYRKRSIEGQAGENERIIALNAKNGHTIWEYQYAAPPIPGQDQYGGGIGPHATPLYFHGRVYAVGYTGQFHCLDSRSGELLWKYDLVNDLQVDPVQFGFSASPIAYEDHIIIQASGPESGLMALNAKTGAVVWKSPAAKFSYSTPLLINYQTKTQIIFLHGDAVSGISPATGAQLWQFALKEPGLTNVPTPIWMEDGKLLIAGQGVNGVELLQMSGSASSIQIESVWRNNRASLFFSNWVRIEDHVFGGESFFNAINWKSGKVSWKERGFKDANLLTAGDHAIILSQDGELTLAKLTSEKAEIISRFTLFDGNAWTAPTLLGNTLFARNRELAVALDLGKKSSASGAQLPSYRKIKFELKSLLESGQTLDALQRFTETHVRYPGLIGEGMLAEFGASLLSAGKYEDAIAVFKTNSDAFPGSPDALALLARSYLISGDPSTAADIYQELLQINSEHPEAAQIYPQLRPEGETTGNMEFKLNNYSSSRLVTVAGNFNGWNPMFTLLQKTDQGWRCTLNLEAGTYQYKFIVDGKWILDPGNPSKQDDGNGNINSIIVVP